MKKFVRRLFEELRDERPPGGLRPAPVVRAEVLPALPPRAGIDDPDLIGELRGQLLRRAAALPEPSGAPGVLGWLTGEFPEVTRARAMVKYLEVGLTVLRKLDEVDGLDHERAMRKLTEHEKAAEVRLKQAAATDRELDAQRKLAELGRPDTPREPKPSDEERLFQARLKLLEREKQLKAAGYSDEAAKAEAQRQLEDERARYRTKGT